MVRTQVKKRPRTRYRQTTRARAIHNGLDLQQRLEHIKTSLGAIGDNISDKASDVVASSIRRAKRQSKRVGRYVTHKPYRSLGIAAVVTAVCLGFLFRNR